MVDEMYKNSFKEVYEILNHTDEELVSKVPKSFIIFLKDNMNINYKTNIKKDVPIDKQKILKETEAILALIFKSYWATDDEIAKIKDRQEFKNIEEIFAKKKLIDNAVLTKDLTVIKKESIIKRFIKRLFHIYKK